jgi:hypothetical protein
MGLDQNSLTELTQEIMAQGYDEETASYYAVRIGDTPGFDENGKLVVMNEHGQVITRLQPLKFFATKKHKSDAKRRERTHGF